MTEKIKLGTRVSVKNSGLGTVVGYEDDETFWVYLDDFMEDDIENIEDITILKEEKTGFKPGDRVYSVDAGMGTVVQVNETMVNVFFDDLCRLQVLEHKYVQHREE